MTFLLGGHAIEKIWHTMLLALHGCTVGRAVDGFPHLMQCHVSLFTDMKAVISLGGGWWFTQTVGTRPGSQGRIGGVVQLGLWKSSRARPLYSGVYW